MSSQEASENSSRLEISAKLTHLFVFSVVTIIKSGFTKLLRICSGAVRVESPENFCPVGPAIYGQGEC